MIIGLTAQELAQIRSDISLLLPDVCDILAVTRTSDGAGGWSETISTVKSNVPCRLDFPNPGKEMVSNASNTPFKTGMLSMAYDQTVTTANQILKGGITYNIVGVNTGQSWIGVVRCAVEAVL